MTRHVSSALRRAAAAPVLVVALVAVLGACSQPEASFSAGGPCVADGQAAGAYPELEALAPRDLGGVPPTILNSGRSCSDRALGSLKARAVDELRFAGATWDEGDGAGTSIAVLSRAPGSADGLPATWIEEFYEAGARSSSRTSNIETSRPDLGAAGPAWRLDTLNNLSQQTIVVRSLGERVQVVLVATQVEPGASLDVHEARVERAIAVALTVEAGAPASPVLPSPG